MMICDVLKYYFYFVPIHFSLPSCPTPSLEVIIFEKKNSIGCKSRQNGITNYCVSSVITTQLLQLSSHNQALILFCFPHPRPWII